MDNYPRSCMRCGKSFARTSSMMSRFNTDMICGPCGSDERQAPGYEAAAAAELRAGQQGNYNFPGVGLTPKDRSFLAQRLSERVKVA